MKQDRTKPPSATVENSQKQFCDVCDVYVVSNELEFQFSVTVNMSSRLAGTDSQKARSAGQNYLHFHLKLSYRLPLSIRLSLEDSVF